MDCLVDVQVCGHIAMVHGRDAHKTRHLLQSGRINVLSPLPELPPVVTFVSYEDRCPRTHASKGLHAHLSRSLAAGGNTAVGGQGGNGGSGNGNNANGGNNNSGNNSGNGGIATGDNGNGGKGGDAVGGELLHCALLYQASKLGTSVPCRAQLQSYAFLYTLLLCSCQSWLFLVEITKAFSVQITKLFLGA